jgi:hypothetical protein
MWKIERAVPCRDRADAGPVAARAVSKSGWFFPDWKNTEG